MDWFLYDNGLHHERVKSDPGVAYQKISACMFVKAIRPLFVPKLIGGFSFT